MKNEPSDTFDSGAKPGENPREQSGQPAAPHSNSNHLSLEGLHGSVPVPADHAGFWKQMAAFFGPAVLVSVAYMDPGNWGTDLAAGAKFKYDLLWVVAVASLMAIFLQMIAAR